MLDTVRHLDVNQPQLTVFAQINENIFASLNVADLSVQDVDTSNKIPAVGQHVDYNVGTNTASFTFPGYANGILPDDNYQAAIYGASVSDLAGNPPVLDGNLNFFFFDGDANQDGVINS